MTDLSPCGTINTATLPSVVPSWLTRITYCPGSIVFVTQSPFAETVSTSVPALVRKRHAVPCAFVRVLPAEGLLEALLIAERDQVDPVAPRIVFLALRRRRFKEDRDYIFIRHRVEPRVVSEIVLSQNIKGILRRAAGRVVEIYGCH